MKKIIKFSLSAMAMAAVMMFSSCEEENLKPDDPNEGNQGNTEFPEALDHSDVEIPIVWTPYNVESSGIGVSITGIIIRSRVVMWSPLVGFCFAIYMLMAYTLHQAVTIDWYLYFGLSFVVMMVLPGHYLNRKARNVC